MYYDPNTDTYDDGSEAMFITEMRMLYELYLYGWSQLVSRCKTTYRCLGSPFLYMIFIIFGLFPLVILGIVRVNVDIWSPFFSYACKFKPYIYQMKVTSHIIGKGYAYYRYIISMRIIRHIIGKGYAYYRHMISIIYIIKSLLYLISLYDRAYVIGHDSTSKNLWE